MPNLARVSIIVPVYNVKDYLDDCINSILSQTFTDFELILVDDGSTDGSGDICESYSKTDDRIYVLHKANGGLSSARNAGIDWALENSRSDFFLFIDSDDAVKSDLLEKAFSAQEKNDADIVIFGFEMTDEDLIPLTWGCTKETSAETFMENYRLSPFLPPYDFGDYAWNKLYKKHLFLNVRYPEGLNFEDTYTTYKIFHLAKKIISLPDRLYLYRRRQESITTKGGIKSKRDYFEAIKQKYFFIDSNYNVLSQNATAGAINSIAAILNQIPIEDETGDYTELIYDIRKFLLESIGELNSNNLINQDIITLCNKLKQSPKSLRLYRKRKGLRQGLNNKVRYILNIATAIKRKVIRN